MTRPKTVNDPHDEAWRASMDLWRQDVGRAASAIDPEAVARRALEAAATAATQGALESRAYRRYAAAALLLLGLGVGGSAWLLLRSAGVEPWGPSVVGAVERERMELQGTLEMLALPVARPRGKGD